MKSLKLALLFLLIFGCSTITKAQPLDLYQIQEATVQINADKQQGTATAIGEDSTNYYLLTNAHVILNGMTKRPATNITINAFRAGYKSNDISATLIKHVFVDRTVQDMAFLKVEKSKFGDNPLRVIPIAPDGYVVEPKHFIYSAGCPRRANAMSWVGHIVNTKSWIEFKPFPQPGQSGSAIFGLVRGKDDKLYTRVIGIVTWTSDDPNGVGGAVPIQVYYDVLERKISTAKYNDKIPVSFRFTSNDYAINEDVQYEGRIFPLPRPFQGRLEGIIPQELKPENPIFPNLQPNQPKPNPANPYSEPLPNIGGIWPGTQPEVQPTQPVKPDVPTNVESSVPQIPVAEKPSWFAYLRDNGFGWLQALGLAGVIGILATVWKFRLRAKVVEKTDVVQQHLQDWAAKKVGPEFAAEFREGLEAIESMILGVADNMLQNQKIARTNTIQEQLSKMKGLISIKQMPTEVDVQNLLAAVRAAAADPNEPNVSAEVAKKMEEIVAKTAK